MNDMLVIKHVSNIEKRAKNFTRKSRLTNRPPTEVIFFLPVLFITAKRTEIYYGNVPLSPEYVWMIFKV